VRPNAKENGQIRQSNTARTVGNIGNHPPSRIWASSQFRKRLPSMSVQGSSGESRITSDGPATKVIFLSAAATDGQILTAITRGGKGIMLKDIAPESLADCVRQVASRRQWFPADDRRCCHGTRNGRRVQSKQLVQTLTPRERQVVVSLCEGNSNKKIARQLNFTEGTVKVHLSNIYNKLGVANRTALTALRSSTEISSIPRLVTSSIQIGRRLTPALVRLIRSQNK